MSEGHFQDLRQGSVVEYSGHAGLNGAHVVVSQTCDVVLAKREYLQLAPLIALEGSERRQALKHENPRYPRVGQGEDCLFADLAWIVSVLKGEVLDVPAIPGHEFATDADERDFGLAVGRWFGRFAVPDEVHFWLAPLQKLVRSKYDKPASPIGRVLNHVSEIRVESNDWNSSGMLLTIHVIVEAGWLPSLPDEVVYSDDEFPLSKMRRSEQLDIDFLSPPVPYGDDS
ncbi:hypothetical protein [Brevibacterium oceani]|uniref:hypothetical protein n=1 Tax=Brevibacterium oceani TaxID=358099 RepID=UPI001B345552|nr:hypothetical protein [Brevibacterium oceani]